MKKIHGFNLIELMTTVAIISIVTVLSVPLFTQHFVQQRRLEAEAALSKAAVAMERYHIEHNSYEHATLAALDIAETVAKNNYRVKIQSATDHDFILAANPIGDQAHKDSECGTLTLQANGEKSVTGSGNVSACW